MASAVVVSGDASAGSAAAAAATGDTAVATESAVVAGGAATFKAPTTSLSRNWKVDKKHVASFTGGTAAFTPDGANLQSPRPKSFGDTSDRARLESEQSPRPRSFGEKQRQRRAGAD